MSSLRFSPLALFCRLAKMHASWRERNDHSPAPRRANSSRRTPGAWRSARVTAFRSHDVKQPSTQHISFPRRIRARVFANFFHPDEGWAERRQAPGCCGIRLARRVTQDAHERAYVTRRAGALARRPCVPQVRRDARLSALHRGDFGSGFRASISGISSRAVQRSSSQPGRSAWRADFPNLPRVLVTSQLPRDAIPCSAFRIVSRKRPS
jgi:hypothetical protein